MDYTLSITNLELINHLDNLEQSEHIYFLNNLLNLGFKEYKKQNLDTDNNVINLVNSEFDQIKLLINEIKLEAQNNSLLLNKNNNKGIIGETLIYDFFITNKYQIEDTHAEAHSGDLKLYLNEINEHVLIEIKNYKNTVDQKQIDKFYYDLKYTGLKLGIFISLDSKIVNIKYPIEWRITDDNNIIIFISECKEEYLYIAIFSMIALYNNNKISNNIFKQINNEELVNDIKYLSIQKETINKLKNEILSLHSNHSSTILNLYNNLCIFDNNFNYILNKIHNKLDSIIAKPKNSNIYLLIDNITTSNINKELLEMIISDLNVLYKLDLEESATNKKIKISKNEKYIGEIKILKTTLNLILSSGLELKNINKENWNKIINLLEN